MAVCKNCGNEVTIPAGKKWVTCPGCRKLVKDEGDDIFTPIKSPSESDTIGVNMVKCRWCKEPIPRGSKKCRHCGEYQNDKDIEADKKSEYKFDDSPNLSGGEILMIWLLPKFFGIFGFMALFGYGFFTGRKKFIKGTFFWLIFCIVMGIIFQSIKG